MLCNEPLTFLLLVESVCLHSIRPFHNFINRRRFIVVYELSQYLHIWTCSGGSSIPRKRGRRPGGGRGPTYDFAKFSPKNPKELQDIEKILGRRGEGAPLDPPMTWNSGSDYQWRVLSAPFRSNFFHFHAVFWQHFWNWCTALWYWRPLGNPGSATNYNCNLSYNAMHAPSQSIFFHFHAVFGINCAK